LVNITVPADKLEETVRDLVRKISANSLEAIAAYKFLYNHTMKDTLQKGLEFEKYTEFNISATQTRVDSFRKKKSK